MNETKFSLQLFTELMLIILIKYALSCVYIILSSIQRFYCNTKIKQPDNSSLPTLLSQHARGEPLITKLNSSRSYTKNFIKYAQEFAGFFLCIVPSLLLSCRQPVRRPHEVLGEISPAELWSKLLSSREASSTTPWTPRARVKETIATKRSKSSPKKIIHS